MTQFSTSPIVLGWLRWPQNTPHWSVACRTWLRVRLSVLVYRDDVRYPDRRHRQARCPAGEAPMMLHRIGPPDWYHGCHSSWAAVWDLRTMLWAETDTLLWATGLDDFQFSWSGLQQKIVLLETSWYNAQVKNGNHPDQQLATTAPPNSRARSTW